MSKAVTPERTLLAPGLEISRVVTGFWQVADMERDGRILDAEAAARAMAEYAAAGFDTFDMADHYGSAEVFTGHYFSGVAAGRLAPGPHGTPRAFTKWCPPPGPMTPEIVGAGVDRSRRRMQVDTIDLLQFHWWTFHHPDYIDALEALKAIRAEGRIRHLGVTNFDTDHLRLAIRHGIPIASNQISFSLLDRRAAGAMSAFCSSHGVRLLAYGALGGGFLTGTWLGRAEPTSLPDWSKSKYKRFIDVVGGWSVLQRLLHTLAAIAKTHDVSVANVATRWVLQQPAVAAIIVGARLGEREHRADNRRLFSFALDRDDLLRIDEALEAVAAVPGDCGDEYRRPPFLTASGDLSHHLDSMPKVFEPSPVPGRPGRRRISSGSEWEPIAGYSRAVRVGQRILVSGTTATHGAGKVICPGDVAAQTVYILDKIAASIVSLGGTLDDVVQTRVYLKDAEKWEAAARVHGRYFRDVRPANTLIEVGDLVGDYEVEIDAEAVVD
jgi:aryl-alcohol dehydrogenase-like predicted oxidoreductase/enamine deaminase RidA (YjgF/YER057c/UK114 family)